MTDELDRTNAQGDGTCLFPSGNVAAVVCKTPQGMLITFFSDSATNSQVVGSFDQQGVGGIMHPNGKPWLVVTRQGWSVSDKAGGLVERGRFPRDKKLEPLTFEVSEWLSVTFVDRQNIMAKLQCGVAMKEWQCGEQPRRTDSHLDKVVGSKKGKLELDVSAIRQRQQDVGSLYMAPGPHAYATELPGIGGARSTLRGLKEGTSIATMVADLRESDVRVQRIDTLPKSLYGTTTAKQLKEALLDYGEPPLSAKQKSLLGSMRPADGSKALFTGSRSKLPQLSMADVQAKVSCAEGYEQDTLCVLCILADWNPVSRRIEPQLQSAHHALEAEALAGPTSPGGHIKMFKVDASESSVLQQRYAFRTNPMFLLFYDGKLVLATNALHNSADVKMAAYEALSKGRKHEFLPDSFSFAGQNIGDSSLDFIKAEMRLAL